MLSPLVTLGFVPLTLFVWAALAALIARHARPALPVVGASALWLLLTGVLASAGFFRNFVALPPRIPVFVAAEFGALIWLIFFSRWRNELTRIPPRLIVAMQCFRVPVEILLGTLAARHLLPVEMSFHGRNFDVITGITALPLAAWMATHPGRGRKLLFTWNVMGLCLVTAVVAHGMLSTPYRFQQIHLSVDNYIIGYFPVNWLPMFLVPVAYALHFVSLRQGGKHA